MRKIRAMLVEDERLAREELIYLLQQEADIEIAASVTNGRELLELMEREEPDVLFLDIQMPEFDGMQTAKMLRSRMKKVLIVFTTAHEGYAIDAFELDAADYLLKPYSHLRLKETLDRIRRRMDEQARREQKDPAPFAAKLNKLLIEDEENVVFVDPDRILYAMRDEKVVRLYTTDHKIITTKCTLQELEKKLQDYPFFRPHRSYLINLNQVVELVPWFNGAYNLILNDAKRTQVPVSRDSAKDLLKLL